jgi:hypothetical protein
MSEQHNVTVAVSLSRVPAGEETSKMNDLAAAGWTLNRQGPVEDVVFMSKSTPRPLSELDAEREIRRVMEPYYASLAAPGSTRHLAGSEHAPRVIELNSKREGSDEEPVILAEGGEQTVLLPDAEPE